MHVASNTGRSLCFNLRGDGLFRDILSAVLDELFLTEWTTRLVNDFTLYGNQLAFAALEMIGPAHMLLLGRYIQGHAGKRVRPRKRGDID